MKIKSKSRVDVRSKTIITRTPMVNLNIWMTVEEAQTLAACVQFGPRASVYENFSMRKQIGAALKAACPKVYEHIDG